MDWLVKRDRQTDRKAARERQTDWLERVERETARWTDMLTERKTHTGLDWNGKNDRYRQINELTDRQRQGNTQIMIEIETNWKTD